jgi:hypothetical protein
MLIVEKPLSDSWRIKPSLLISTHGGAKQVNLQTRVYRRLGPTHLIGGMGLRNNTVGYGNRGLAQSTDAPFVIAGFIYKDAEFSASYDINVSLLRQATHYRGAFELAILWRNTHKVFVDQVVVPCIRI